MKKSTLYKIKKIDFSGPICMIWTIHHLYKAISSWEGGSLSLDVSWI